MPEENNENQGLVFLNQSEKIEKGYIQFTELNNPSATPDDPEIESTVETDTMKPISAAAAKILLDYYIESTTPSTSAPRTTDGRLINGFYYRLEDELVALISKKSIVGLYLGIGKYPDDSHTLVLHGVGHEYGIQSAYPEKIELHLKDFEIFDFCDICPPKCPRVI